MNLELPLEWRRGPLRLLDVLLWIRRKEQRAPLLAMIVGGVDARMFQAFIDGLSFSQLCSGEEDPEYDEFLRWLRQTGVSTIEGGWWGPLLVRTGGSQLEAIDAFLALAAEFRDHRSARS